MLNKILFTIFSLFAVLILFNNQLFAQTLKGGVQESWTIDKIRQEAFRNAQYFRNLRGFKETDPFFLENKMAILKAKTSTIRLKDRVITVFYEYNTKHFEGYAVKIDNKDIAYYYTEKGKLFAVEYGHKPEYPQKTYRYSYPKGKLTNVGFSPSGSDNYLFHPTGNLETHCINEKCYDKNGKPVILRENF